MRTILLIDDDPVVRGALAQHLRARRWEVCEAEDGQSGLEMARAVQPAVVLCDLLMPRLNGFQVIAALSNDPALRGTKVIAMSSKAYPRDRESALEAGAQEFLLKPITPQGVAAFLDGLAAQAEPARVKPAANGQSTLIKFWGVRGSIPSPGPGTIFYGGNTPCVEVRTAGKIIILDSGTGIRRLGQALEEEFKEMEVTILLTHTHWDHIQGFPFFAPIYHARNKIRVLGYEGAREGLGKVLSNQMESPHFPIGLKDLPGHLSIQELKEMDFMIDDIKVRAAFANHPGICVGYRLETARGGIVYLPDHEPYGRQIGASAGSVQSAFIKAEAAKLNDFFAGAEVLVLDTQYDLSEYQSHQGWGHGCVEDVVEVALQAGVRRLFLFHHDPDHDDEKITSMVQSARKLAVSQGSKLIIEAAREGEKLILNS